MKININGLDKDERYSTRLYEFIKNELYRYLLRSNKQTQLRTRHHDQI